MRVGEKERVTRKNEKQKNSLTEKQMRRVEQPTSRERRVDKAEWFDKLRAALIDKQDMNMLVMDYFIKEGYADAAAAFQEESLTEPVTIGKAIARVDLSSLKSRAAVRDAVHEGDALKAVERLNELDPKILEERPRLFFQLLQERLVELIQCASPRSRVPLFSPPVTHTTQNNTEMS